jgi:4-hydroxybenzoate polyprenyltransferase
VIIIQNIVRNLYLNFHYLSIDVALGGVGISLYIFSFFSIEVPCFYWLILALSIFAVYNVDHLLDSYVLDGKIISNPRRTFHIHNRLQVLGLLFFSILVNLYLVWKYLDIREIYLGVGLTIFILVYFGMNIIISNFPKEIFVGIIYTLGVSIIPAYTYLVEGGGNLLFVTPLLGIIFLITFINLLVNSYLDIEEDRKEKSISLFQKFEEKTILALIAILGITGVSFLIILNVFDYFPNMYHSILFFVAISFPVLLVSPIFSNISLVFWIRKSFRFLGEVLFFQFIFLV